MHANERESNYLKTQQTPKKLDNWFFLTFYFCDEKIKATEGTKQLMRGNLGSKLSLKAIEILLIVFVVVVPDLIIFSIVYNDVGTSLSNQLYADAKNNVQMLNDNITQFINEDTYAINAVSKQLSGGDLSKKQSVQDLLSQVPKSHASINAVTVGNNQGQYVRSPQAVLENKVNHETWYKQAMANPGKIIITPPFISTLDHKLTIVMAKSTPDGKAAVGMDVDISSLQKIVKKVSVELQQLVAVFKVSD